MRIQYKMKIHLLTWGGLFFIISTYATAENWTLITGSKGIDFYIDKDLIITNGDTRKVWVMWDVIDHHRSELDHGYRYAFHPVIDGELSYRSAKIQEEFNCLTRKQKFIHEIFFEGQKGSGERIERSPFLANLQKNEHDIVPNSVSETIFSYVCH